MYKLHDLKLFIPPTAPVTIKITSDDRLEIDPNQVMFTPDNWSTPQQITIRARWWTRHRDARGLITHTLNSANSRLDGETTTMPVLIRNWRLVGIYVVVR
ncbi:MAG: hypothetical protein R3C44_14345 [Chloroflexota bacterium]